MQTETEKTITDTLEARGFSLESSDASPGEKAPMLAYSVTLKFKGQIVLTTVFSMGWGHLRPFKNWTVAHWGASFYYSATDKGRIVFRDPNEESLFYSWQNNPHATFKDSARQMSVAVAIANVQKLKPTLPAVVNSLLLDGSAFFDAETFENWAANFEYDSDSIKAREMFEACDKTGRAIAAKVPREIIEQTRETLRDY